MKFLRSNSFALEYLPLLFVSSMMLSTLATPFLFFLCMPPVCILVSCGHIFRLVFLSPSFLRRPVNLKQKYDNNLFALTLHTFLRSTLNLILTSYSSSIHRSCFNLNGRIWPCSVFSASPEWINVLCDLNFLIVICELRIA